LSKIPFLAGALARRLTHDLAGPLAALVTISELSPGADPLLAQAIAEMQARLSLARLLFGGEPTAPFDRGEALERLTAHLDARGHRLTARLPVQDRPARGTLLLCLAAADRLTAPGAIAATPESVEAHGRHREIAMALEEALATGTTADPQLAAAAVAAALLGPLRVSPSPSGLVFSAALP
jgi:hypothetical protein